MSTNLVAQNRKWPGASQSRRRVSRACERCRGRKYRCDGGHPCTSCSNAEKNCTYGSDLPKRGLIEGYVRGMERLLGLAVASNPGFDSLVISFISNYGDSDDPFTQPTSGLFEGHEQGHAMLESWKTSKIRQNIKRLIPALEALDSSGRGNKTLQMASHIARNELQGPIAMSASQVSTDPEQVDMPMGGTDCTTAEGVPDSPVSDKNIPKQQCAGSGPGLPQTEAVLAQESNLNGQLPIDHRGHHPLTDPPSYSAVESTEWSDSSRSLLSRSELPQYLPQEASEMLDSYFRFSHCWFPIVEKHSTQRLCYQYAERSKSVIAASIATTGTGEIAALWAVLAYEASFQPCEERRDGDGANTTCPSSASCVCSSNPYGVARSLIPNEDTRCELGHVQALLLLTLCNMRRARWRPAWLLVGHAIRISLDMGLQKTTEGERMSTRKLHVFLGCFILETLVSARLERMPSLRGDSLRDVQLLGEDGPDEWDTWRPLSVHERSGPSFISSTFNSTVEVIRVLNDFICNSLDSSGVNEQQAGDYEARLSKITQSRQAFLSTNTRECPMPHRALLGLTHAAVETAVRARLSNDNHNSPKNAPDHTKLKWYLAQCRKAFGPKRLPPLAEYSGYVALRWFNTQQNTPNIAEIGEELSLYASNGSGAAFRQLHECVRDSRVQPPQLECIPPSHGQATCACASGLNMASFRGRGHALSPSAQSRDVLPGIQGVPSAALTSSSVIAPQFLPADHHTELCGEDGVFDSLALLDATTWSVGWGDQLTELGFADSTTFMEFCNDNERVMDY